MIAQSLEWKAGTQTISHCRFLFVLFHFYSLVMKKWWLCYILNESSPALELQISSFWFFFCSQLLYCFLKPPSRDNNRKAPYLRTNNSTA